MSNFIINQNKLLNNNSIIKPTTKKNYGLKTVVYNFRHKYSNNIIGYYTEYSNYIDTSEVSSNDTKSIRLTLTPQAVRNNQFKYYLNTFNRGYPQNYVYSFCNPELATVFQYSSSFYTKKNIVNSGHPNNINIQNVIDSISNNEYGNNSACCPNGLVPDPITGLCSNSDQCVPDPVTPCPEPEFINLKNTIFGYVFYLDQIRKIHIPNIGERLVRCAGGHRCNRTHFKPKLILSDSTVIYGSNNISLDNAGVSVPSYNPIDFDQISDGERSDSFTFVVPDPSLLNTDCNVELECLYPGCHTGVVMIFLVGQRSDTDEYVLLFADCVAPGSFNSKFLGSIPCNDLDPPNKCSPTTPPPPPPPPNCNYTSKTQAEITFENINIPFETMGDQDLIDQLLLLIYNGPHIMPLTNVDSNGISTDQYLIGTVSDTIQVILYFGAVTDGLGNLDVYVGLNVIQTASAYPYAYGISFNGTVPDNNLCNFDKIDGQLTEWGNGISNPRQTGNGSESVSVVLS